jgi:uncharacterized protein (TIGR00251 family)
VELRVLVQPRASRDQVTGIQGEELKVRLAAPPVDGAANAACCAFLAKLCRLPRAQVTLTAGETSRHKRLLLAGTEVAAVLARLEAYTGVDKRPPSD